MTYRELCRYGEAFLNESDIKDYKVDAWLLMEYVTGFDRTAYFMRADEAIEENQKAKYLELLRQRGKRIPLQHLTKEQEFMGLKFKVNSSVLIPRQDTETLVEEVLKEIKPGMQVLDLCTGSGCIIISILHNAPGAVGAAIDISKQALNVAKENARQNGVSVDFEQSDLFHNVVGTFDVIVSNPPYIPSAEVVKLMPEVGEFEPLEALDGKEDGLYFYREIIGSCRDYLKPEGRIFFEIGFDQAEAVSKMLWENGFKEVRVIKDLARNDRVVTGML